MQQKNETPPKNENFFASSDAVAALEAMKKGWNVVLVLSIA